MADHPIVIAINRVVCIYSMPDEILLKIMKFACKAEEISNERVRYPAGFWGRYTKICYSMAIIDHRFHRLATPLLYHYVCLGAPDNIEYEHEVRVSNFHRTLKEAPALRVHVRRLDIYFSSGFAIERSCIAKNLRVIALWAPNLAFLGICYGSADDVSEFITATLVNLDHLTCLSIIELDGDLDIGSIFQTLNGSCMIDKIAIDQMDCHLAPCDAVRNSSLRKPFCSFMANYGFFNKHSDIAPFTQLEFVCHSVPGELLSDLISWPSTLHSVILRDSCHCIDMFGTDLSIVIVALSAHEKTLKKLDVASVCMILNPTSHPIGISSLPVLEELTLSRWSFSADLKFSHKLGEKLLGPSLRRFTWSFEPAWDAEGDDARHALSDIGSDEEEWLVAFGTFAAQREGLSKLQWIHVRFTPHLFFRREHSFGRIAVWPWDRLQNVKKRLARHGIEVTYSKPTCTRKKWQRLLDAEME